MDKKKYIDIISAQADKNHRPHELALNDFLDYLFEFFSVEAFQSGPDTYHQHLLDCTQKCPEFAGLATLWLTEMHCIFLHYLVAHGRCYGYGTWQVA